MNFSIKISSICLALLFIATINFKSIITVSYFINQSEIIELFCINKENAKLECYGKCHLSSQLSGIDDKTKDTPFPQSNISPNLEISFSLLENKLTIQPKSNKLLNQIYFNHTPSTFDGYNSILSPPPKG